MGECRKVLPSQLQLAKERAQQHRVGNQTDVEVWREAFIKIASSRFQTGRVAPTKGRNRYKLTLSELLKTHIFRETINGKYISPDAIGRASCGDRVCQSVLLSVVAVQ